MRVATGFYDDLNQFHASLKEGCNFKMTYQLKNHEDFLRDVLKFVNVALIAGIFTQLKLNKADTQFITCLIGTLSVSLRSQQY